MVQRFAATACLTLLLFACGGSGGESSVECVLEYWNGEVGTCLPEGWGVINRETLLLRGVTDELAVVFQADQAVSGQFPLVSVTQQRLSAQTDPLSFSQESVRSVTTLSGYTLVDLRDMTIDDNAVQLHIFRARPQISQPERTFYQVSTVQADKGYTFTGMTPVSVSGRTESEVLKIVGCATWHSNADVRAERLSEC